MKKIIIMKLKVLIKREDIEEDITKRELLGHYYYF